VEEPVSGPRIPSDPLDDLWAIDPTTLSDILYRTAVQEALQKPGTVKRLRERYGDAAVSLCFGDASVGLTQ
jgi:hypothetical protein